MNDEAIQKAEAVLKKYCVPSKDHDQVSPKEVTTEIIQAYLDATKEQA